MVVGLISSADIPGCYKRIGVFDPRHSGRVESPYYHLWETAEEKTITIV